ncbi:MAG: hypothetical protein OXP66_06490 [Candidatus Tectomicrobia bacterium]|nr:hypothetical protein [Candidatus Tectomicrobia bacterium]
MNADFMQLLARRLERVEWVDARLAECTFPESFEGVDGFFMGPDLVKITSGAEVVVFRGRRLGSIQAWAVQLIHEQGGYHDGDKGWVAEKPHGIALHEAGDLALVALGLAELEQVDGASSFLVLEDHSSDALLSPPFLHGRMRGIGPGAAAAVLRRCADGTAPQDAWGRAAQELRESRLRELADALEAAPHAVVAAWDEPTPAWSSQDLERLTHFSMLNRYRPSVMQDGAWCGDVAMWVWKLFGADAENYFGSEANAGIAASVMLGLTPLEAMALFEAGVPPAEPVDLSEMALCGALTPELAAGAVRDLAEGVFPSVAWDDLREEVDLDDWMEEVLRNRAGNGHAPSSNGDHSAVNGAAEDEEDEDD